MNAGGLADAVLLRGVRVLLLDRQRVVVADVAKRLEERRCHQAPRAGSGRPSGRPRPARPACRTVGCRGRPRAPTWSATISVSFMWTCWTAGSERPDDRERIHPLPEQVARIEVRPRSDRRPPPGRRAAVGHVVDDVERMELEGDPRHPVALGQARPCRVHSPTAGVPVRRREVRPRRRATGTRPS